MNIDWICALSGFGKINWTNHDMKQIQEMWFGNEAEGGQLSAGHNI